MKKQDMRPLMKPYDKTKGGDKTCTEDAYMSDVSAHRTDLGI